MSDVDTIPNSAAAAVVNHLMLGAHAASIRGGCWADPITGDALLRTPEQVAPNFILIVGKAVEFQGKLVQFDKLVHQHTSNIKHAKLIFCVADLAIALVANRDDRDQRDVIIVEFSKAFGIRFPGQKKRHVKAF